MDNFERQWAVAMKKTNLKAKIPLQTNEDDILELLKLKKEQLNTAIKEKNQVQAEKILKTITKENERLLILRLRKIQEKNGYLDERVAQKFVTKHLTVCAQLTLLVRSLT